MKNERIAAPGTGPLRSLQPRESTSSAPLISHYPSDDVRYVPTIDEHASIASKRRLSTRSSRFIAITSVPSTASSWSSAISSHPKSRQSSPGRSTAGKPISRTPGSNGPSRPISPRTEDYWMSTNAFDRVARSDEDNRSIAQFQRVQRARAAPARAKHVTRSPAALLLEVPPPPISRACIISAIEWVTKTGLRRSRKHSARRGSRLRRRSASRKRSAPPSLVIVPPSKAAPTRREKCPSNSNSDWLHSVIAKAVSSLALTAVWKLSYAMKDGFLLDPL